MDVVASSCLVKNLRGIAKRFKTSGAVRSAGTERGSKVRRNMAARDSSATSANVICRSCGTKAILGAKVLEKAADTPAKCGEHVTTDHGSERAQEGR